MSYKKYLLFRLLGILVIAAIGAWAGTSGNLLALIPAVIIIGFILVTMKRRVNEIVVDERVNTIAYRASRMAFVVFILLAVIAGVVLIYQAQDKTDVLFHVGLTLNYTACALMVFYWVAFMYYKHKYGGKE